MPQTRASEAPVSPTDTTHVAAPSATRAAPGATAVAPWRLVGASVAGSSHEVTGVPCQDAHVLAVVETTVGQVLVSIVADGAGSASLSGRGSRLACDTARELIERHLAADPALTLLTDDRVHRWVDGCATRLEEMANASDVPVRELACTILIAVIGETRACFAQLGDGAIVVEYESVLHAVTWPQNGEFANTTLFITEPKDRAELQVEFVEGLVGDVALFTDGVEFLALRLQEHCPHAPFFGPLFESVRSLGESDRAEAESSLGDFLASDKVRARSDDDLTLVLASRRPPGAPFIPPPVPERVALAAAGERSEEATIPGNATAEAPQYAAPLGLAKPVAPGDSQHS